MRNAKKLGLLTPASDANFFWIPLTEPCSSKEASCYSRLSDASMNNFLKTVKKKVRRTRVNLLKMLLV